MSNRKRKYRPQERQVAQSPLSPTAWRKISYACVVGVVLVWIIFILTATRVLPESMGDFPASVVLLFTLLWGGGGLAAYRYAEEHSEDKKEENTNRKSVPVPYGGKRNAIATPAIVGVPPNKKTTVRYDPQTPADKAITPAISLFALSLVIWMISVVGIGATKSKANDFETIALCFVGIFFALLAWKTVVYLKYTKSTRKFGVSKLRYERKLGDYDGEDELSFVFTNQRLYHKASKITASLKFIEEEFVKGRYAPQIRSEEFDAITLSLYERETAFTLSIPRDAVSNFNPQEAAYWEVEVTNGKGDYFASFPLPLKKITRRHLERGDDA